MRIVPPIFAATCLALAPSHAAVLEVDAAGGADFTTIQSAIDAAVPGQDEVLVRCGVYPENLVMRDRVSLRGERPDCAIVDGQQAGPVIRMTGIGASTTVTGLTIRNGKSLQGGGVRVEGGKPVITRNVISDNGTPVFGDGFYDYGAGVYVSSGGFDPETAPTISFNVVRDNSAFKAGGIMLADVHGAVVTSNLISGNHGSFGGGLYVGLSEADIRNNTFFANLGDYGGGIAAYDIGGTIANNVFYGNDAYGSYADFWTPTLNTVTYAANVTDDVWPGTGFPSGVTLQAPEFVDTRAESFAGFQPRSSSPLVDTGDSAVAAPVEDLRGVPRPLDGDTDGMAVVDVGARENEGITLLRIDGTELRWDRAHHVSQTYNVYRGDLDGLRSTGVYIQDPVSVAGARHFCEVPLGLIDSDAPAAGRGFFYLVTAAGVVEGSLGFDSRRIERPRTLDCGG